MEEKPKLKTPNGVEYDRHPIYAGTYRLYPQERIIDVEKMAISKKWLIKEKNAMSVIIKRSKKNIKKVVIHESWKEVWRRYISLGVPRSLEFIEWAEKEYQPPKRITE